MTVNRVGRSIGSVTRRNRCQGVAPSIIAASSTSPEICCSAAMNRSMKVPDVVKIAMSMNTLSATLGPLSQFHQVRPRNWPLSAAGAWSTPTSPSRMCTTPRGSAIQFGPSMLR
jgi:hypothetical protein